MLWLQIRNWLRRQEGQDLTEYALIIGLIVVVCIAALAVLGGAISGLLAQVAAALSGAMP